MGVSGRIAALFQSAQITPLLALVALLLGIFAVLVTPREEEPQINVTMANVLVPFPGASVRDVEQMVATPAEQVLSQMAGVEHVMGYCTEAQYRSFLAQTPVFEKLLIDDGTVLFKYWLSVDQAQQEKRFAERHLDPLKGWKLSPVDLKSRSKYSAYTESREAMLRATHNDDAPWTLVDFNDQKRGRLGLIRNLLDRLPDTRVDEPVLALPPLKGKLHKEHFGVLKPIEPFVVG